VASDPLRAVDTSVLLRYLLRDHPTLAPAAQHLVESPAPLGVTAVALAEVAWTLTGPRLHVDRGQVVDVLVHLLARENVVGLGLDKAQAMAALLRCRPATGGANFGDALIAASARSAGVAEVYTFDQRFARAGLSPVSPPAPPASS
jgi:predicted nucleic acid-binding protein